MLRVVPADKPYTLFLVGLAALDPPYFGWQ
jgi:hypothetical protein